MGMDLGAVHKGRPQSGGWEGDLSSADILSLFCSKMWMKFSWSPSGLLRKHSIVGDFVRHFLQYSVGYISPIFGPSWFE